MQRSLRASVLALLATACLPGLSRCAETHVRHVVQVSMDGLRGDLLHQLIEQGEFPNFQRLVEEGATTCNARTDYDYTITLPNHTTMLTGRPVLHPAGTAAGIEHGYTHNSMPSPKQTLHNFANSAVTHYIASTLDVVHDHGLSTALFASKAKFVLYEQSYDQWRGAPDTIPPDNGPDKIDSYVCSAKVLPDQTLEMQHALIAQMDSACFAYVFVHYYELDASGHDYGWGSPKWVAAVKRADGYLGDLLALIERNKELRGETALIVTADHGGVGKNHHRADEEGIYTIPFFVWGPGVTAGADLYALNPSTRRDPGSERPDYNSRPQPIRNGDAANLAMAFLGLPSVPGSTINVAQDLRVREVPH